MAMQYSLLHKLDIADDITTLDIKFSYPKIVIFENSQAYRVLDVKCTTEEFGASAQTDVILDAVFKDCFLWYILKSGKIKICDLMKRTEIELFDDRFNISRMIVNDDLLFFISESGECLILPLSNKDIQEKFQANESKFIVQLKKVNTLKNIKYFININGLYFFIENGTIKTECPITGLIENISSNVILEHVLSLEDDIILTTKSNMWLVDLKDSKVIFEFGSEMSNYHPVGIHNRCFYFLTKDLKQIQIYNAWASRGDEIIQNKEVSSNFTLVNTSQESLLCQLKLLLESVLQSSKITSIPSNIISLFEQINDFNELIDIGMKLCQHDLIFKCLLYSLHKRIYDTNKAQWMAAISDLIIKIDLLEYITFRDIHTYDSVNLFNLTYKELCILFLGNSDLDLASICWLKYAFMNLSISYGDIIDILNSIPQNTKIGAIIIWLRNFVPPLLEENPYYIELFVRWSSERVFQMEQSTYWPKIGIKFIESIITVLQTSFRTISVQPISMDDLIVLKDQINYIFELKETYKINILLNEFSSQTPIEVALIMLRRCYTEDLENFLQKFLSPYSSRYSFDFDDVLRSFVDNEAAYSGGEIDGTRLEILLNAFNLPGNKLECLLEVLKILDVPWNKTVLELAINAAASATKDFTLSESEKVIAKEIKKELNYAEVKVILKKYNFPLTCTDYTTLLHNVVNAPVVDLNDLHILKSVLGYNINYANLLYLIRCLLDSEIKLALEYFSNLSKTEKKVLLKSVVSKFEQMINRDVTCMTLERNYLDFIKGTRLLNEIQIKDIENLYKLKLFYDYKLYLNNLNIEKSHVNDMTAGSVLKIMEPCQYPYLILLKLLNCTSVSHQVRKFVTNVLSSKDVNYSYLSHFENGNSLPILIESFNVLTELSIKCREEHLHYLLNHLSVMNALIKSNTILKSLSATWKFQYIYLPVSSNNSINELINFYKYFLNVNNVQLSSFEDCLNNSGDFNAFRFVSHLACSKLNSTEICNLLLYLKDTTIRRILNKIIASQNFDEALTTSLLLILRTLEDVNNSNMWIIDALRGQNEILSPLKKTYISAVPIRYTFALDTIVNAAAVTYSPQYILKTKYNIILSEISIPEQVEEMWDVKIILLYVLKQYPDTSMQRLLEICNVLNITLNDGLSLQLISLLSSWELNYKSCQDEFGNQHIIVNTDDKIFNKCSIIWESIENKDFLTDILTDFWKNGEVTLHGSIISMNAYYYEVFLCIYQLLFGLKKEIKNTKEYYLLNFLKNYKRISVPKQYEFEQFSIKGIFPEIGYFRLPFHLFMQDDMWTNLKSEITLESYERWLPVVTLLSLDSDVQTAKDMVCSNAVKQTMTSRKRNEGVNSKDGEPWSLIAKEEPLLRAAHRCVRHIANMEWAGACLFYVLQGCTRGADQVAAAHLCYQFAQRWAVLQTGNRAVRQMERLHVTLSTRHVLHKMEWACEELLRLSTEPAQLIRALYLHPDFLKKIVRYDVNRAANEIADRNGINISTIRIQILENILEISDLENNINDISTLNTKELMTVKYILKATCPKMGAIYLSRIAFDDDCNQNKIKKLRALQSLVSIIESDTAIKVTNLEREALWVSLLDFLCVVRLENIDLPWIITTFNQNKISALEQLLQEAEGNPAALKIASIVAIRFGSPKTLQDLIVLLLRAHMYQETVPLLLKVSITPPNNILYVAWKTVILSPFKIADYPITEKQRINCLNALNLLPLCPVIKDEDLKEIWKNCLRVKCLGLGCLILPYMTSQTRQTLTELSKIDRRNIIASLKNLQTDSYLVSGAMYVVENMITRTYK